MNKNKKYVCKLCGSKNTEITNNKLRDSDKLNVIKCNNCTAYFLSSFSHINEDFYSNGNMHKKSSKEYIEKWEEASYKDDLRRYNFLKNTIKNKTVCDFGCGAGGFIKLCKENSKNTVGVEKQKNLFEHFKKNKIEVKEDINLYENKFDVITLFHVLEHLKNPEVEINNLLQKITSNGEIIIEIPNNDDILLSLYKNKAFANYTYWSCHLFMYNKKSIKKLLKKMGVKINYIKNIQRYSLMNHLYWIIKGTRGGHIHWAKYDYKFLNFLYSNFLKLINKTDTLIISISKK